MFRVQDSEIWERFGLRVQDSGCGDHSLGFRVKVGDLGCEIWGLTFRILGLGFTEFMV